MTISYRRRCTLQLPIRVGSTGIRNKNENLQKKESRYFDKYSADLRRSFANVDEHGPIAAENAIVC